MRLISGAHFRDEVVYMDDTHFLDCTLTHCTLVFRGDVVTLERTGFEGCRIFFEDAANRTVQLLQCLGYLPEALQEFEVFPSAMH